MILKNSDFDSFASEIKLANKKIICFGAGTILSTWMPYICKTYDLYQELICCVDNDTRKIGQKINVGNKKLIICSVETLLEYESKDFVILITSSYFADIIEQLDKFPELRTVCCYVAPIIHITHNKEQSISINNFSKDYKIPKLIHYCWFGGGKIPEKNLRCIESWRTYCPNYEIVRWDEQNYDLSKNKYMKQAYEKKYWGFVPDYARIDILHQYGGIYFDTDVELLREPTELMMLDGFCAFEEWPDVNFGSGSGAVKGHKVLEAILEFRRDLDFVKTDGSLDLRSCGYFETIPLVDLGLKLDGTSQMIDNFSVLPSTYFNPLSAITGQLNINTQTVGIHHMNWSWVDAARMNERQKTKQNYDKIMERIVQGG